MPLNPILGDCSPVRPDASSASATARSPAPRRSPVASWDRPASRTAGSARCSPTRSSPPARWRSAAAPITKSLELQYLRPLPLDEEVELWGVCVPTGDDTFRARCTITARGKLAVEGSAELVSFESFYARGSSKE